MQKQAIGIEKCKNLLDFRSEIMKNYSFYYF